MSFHRSEHSHKVSVYPFHWSQNSSPRLCNRLGRLWNALFGPALLALTLDVQPNLDESPLEAHKATCRHHTELGPPRPYASMSLERSHRVRMPLRSPSSPLYHCYPHIAYTGEWLGGMLLRASTKATRNWIRCRRSLPSCGSPLDSTSLGEYLISHPSHILHSLRGRQFVPGHRRFMGSTKEVWQGESTVQAAVTAFG